MQTVDVRPGRPDPNALLRVTLRLIASSLAHPWLGLDVDRCCPVSQQHAAPAFRIPRLCLVPVPVVLGCFFWRTQNRPWLPQSHGQRTSALVEAVDLMPTYLALAGIATTTWDFSQLEGTSMVPLLTAGNDTAVSSQEKEEKGSNGSGVAWKNATFSQYPRCNQSKTGAPPWVGPSNNACTGVVDSEFAAMGYSMRTGKALAACAQRARKLVTTAILEPTPPRLSLSLSLSRARARELWGFMCNTWCRSWGVGVGYFCLVACLPTDFRANFASVS